MFEWQSILLKSHRVSIKQIKLLVNYEFPLSNNDINLHLRCDCIKLTHVVYHKNIPNICCIQKWPALRIFLKDNNKFPKEQLTTVIICSVLFFSSPLPPPHALRSCGQRSGRRFGQFVANVRVNGYTSKSPPHTPHQVHIYLEITAPCAPARPRIQFSRGW